MTDLFIIGLGISSISQISKESEHAIESSNEVLYLDTGVATKSYLEQHCPRVTSLYESNYNEGHRRLSAYHMMAAQVITAAIERPPVSFAIHGHPLVAVTAPFTVLRLARTLGLQVQVQPGVSAMDSLFADLEIDPVINGMQMYEATDLLLRRRPLQTDVPALIWQIGSLESVLHTQRRSRPERFTRFSHYLSQFYSQEQIMTAIYSAPHPAMDATKISCQLSELSQYADQFHAGFTLFIPAARQRPIHDLDLLSKLDDRDHLERLTR